MLDVVSSAEKTATVATSFCKIVLLEKDDLEKHDNSKDKSEKFEFEV